MFRHISLRYNFGWMIDGGDNPLWLWLTRTSLGRSEQIARTSCRKSWSWHLTQHSKWCIYIYIYQFMSIKQIAAETPILMVDTPKYIPFSGHRRFRQFRPAKSAGWSWRAVSSSDGPSREMAKVSLEFPTKIRWEHGGKWWKIPMVSRFQWRNSFHIWNTIWIRIFPPFSHDHSGFSGPKKTNPLKVGPKSFPTHLNLFGLFEVSKFRENGDEKITGWVSISRRRDPTVLTRLLDFLHEKMGVSSSSWGYPQSSIWMVFFIINNNPFGGSPIYGNLHIVPFLDTTEMNWGATIPRTLHKGARCTCTFGRGTIRFAQKWWATNHHWILG